jgi:hypothetical protein
MVLPGWESYLENRFAGFNSLPEKGFAILPAQSISRGTDRSLSSFFTDIHFGFVFLPD